MRTLFCTLVLLLPACTQQERAKYIGGTTVINLLPCEKLVNITWKENDIWYLSRPFHEGEVAETYSFKENSSYGVMEGTVVIKETCTK